jgi:hypothetical protein
MSTVGLSPKRILSLAFVSLSLGACAVGWNHTSDRVLEDLFSKHQSEFVALLAEVQVDSTLTTVQRDIVIRAGNSVRIHDGDSSSLQRVGLTLERWQHFQERLRSLRLYGVIKGKDSVEFRVDRGTISNGDSYKGYRWHASVPACHVRESLDGYRRSDEDKDASGNWIACKPLKPHWYLYLFVNR